MKKLIIFILVIMALVMGWQKGWFENGSGSTGAAFSLGDFSIELPKDFTSKEEDVDGFKKYIFESKEARKGFEIAVLPFDEVGPLTRERILQDLPDMIITDEKDIMIGEEAPALAFESVDEGLGPTFEIWFIYGGNLYQARTYLEFGPQMTEILKTFK